MSILNYYIFVKLKHSRFVFSTSKKNSRRFISRDRTRIFIFCDVKSQNWFGKRGNCNYKATPPLLGVVTFNNAVGLGLEGCSDQCGQRKTKHSTQNQTQFTKMQKDHSWGHQVATKQQMNACNKRNVIYLLVLQYQPVNYNKINQPMVLFNEFSQKQPSRGVHRKRCYRKYVANLQTPMSKCDFNKVALQLY